MNSPSPNKTSFIPLCLCLLSSHCSQLSLSTRPMLAQPQDPDPTNATEKRSQPPLGSRLLLLRHFSIIHAPLMLWFPHFLTLICMSSSLDCELLMGKKYLIFLFPAPSTDLALNRHCQNIHGSRLSKTPTINLIYKQSSSTCIPKALNVSDFYSKYPLALN